ncbi:unnamed protein product [marine sediment metagenome]|uniref:Uncharacterized protein n=1 Tax=marine sediment metagenome TaxID=412755 RepID=X0WQX9_9ZZZZ
MLLTDEEIKGVFGGACYSTVCSDCTHGCRFVAKAQLKKDIAYMFGECDNAEHDGANSGIEILRYECVQCRQALLDEAKDV